MRDLKRSLKSPIIHLQAQIRSIMNFYATFLLRQTLHILLDIINETWKNDTFPESWREALIISIPKPGKDHFNPLNYRPIALTSCICKTVERMVIERLVWYLEKSGLLAKQQCGYRSNRSTVDHLVRIETFIRDAFIHTQHLVNVFFDLQNAYRTIPRGNTVSSKIYLAWHYEEIYPFLLAIFYPTELFKPFRYYSVW